MPNSTQFVTVVLITIGLIPHKTTSWPQCYLQHVPLL